VITANYWRGWCKLVKFAEDPEWLQLVRDGYCPECLDQFNPKSRKLFKKGIKRECSQGHLILYGNPLYLAYYRVEKKKEKKKVTGCPKCGGQAVTYDKKHDEIFCDDCGLVLSGPPQWIPPARWVNYPMGNRYDYADIDATYTPYETDRCDYGDYIE
jgi:ribosomal protein S27AE